MFSELCVEYTLDKFRACRALLSAIWLHSESSFHDDINNVRVTFWLGLSYTLDHSLFIDCFSFLLVWITFILEWKYLNFNRVPIKVLLVAKNSHPFTLAKQGFFIMRHRAAYQWPKVRLTLYIIIELGARNPGSKFILISLEPYGLSHLCFA